MMGLTTQLETIPHDVVYALRSMRKTPAFAAIALFTLALGIGGNTTIFTLIRTTLLKPLEYQDPDRLVYLSVENPSQNQKDNPFTLSPFEGIRESAHSFTALGAFGPPEHIVLSTNT